MGIKTPTPPIDESMILPSLTSSALMETACLSSNYQDETERVSSGAWLMKLMDEIDEPDPPHPSVFDYFDYFDGEGLDRQSSADKSRKYSITQVGASESIAVTDDTQRVRLSSMATAFSVVEVVPHVDIDREQSRESPYRESSFLAASVILPQVRSPATTDATVTATAVTDEEQASRKRKVTSNKPVKRTKRALNDPLPQRAPSPNYDRFVGEEDIGDDDILKGRGGQSNHHVGNRKFRKIIADMKGTYKKIHLKTDKTALSRGIVEYIQAKGGRFLIQTTNGQVGWRVMTKEESQKKTSQALRETKKLKWTL